jgi:hypothetical protein
MWWETRPPGLTEGLLYAATNYQAIGVIGTSLSSFPSQAYQAAGEKRLGCAALALSHIRKGVSEDSSGTRGNRRFFQASRGWQRYHGREVS